MHDRICWLYISLRQQRQFLTNSPGTKRTIKNLNSKKNLSVSVKKENANKSTKP